jgi:hypothetical protein
MGKHMESFVSNFEKLNNSLIAAEKEKQELLLEIKKVTTKKASLED